MELLAACEKMPGNRPLKYARPHLEIGLAGLHLDELSALGDTNRHDTNAATRLGTYTNRPPLDLLPDDFLDIGQVGIGFEVTPVSVIPRMLHRSVLSMAWW